LQNNKNEAKKPPLIKMKFSATGAVEGFLKIKTSYGLVSLSEQQLIDCDSNNYGCDGK
jgi:hypothetical protein